MHKSKVGQLRSLNKLDFYQRIASKKFCF